MFSTYADLIENITTSEDLETELSAQETLIQQLKIALQNKTAGGKVKLNIYAQATEPESKDGIWLQTTKTAEHYISDDNIFIGGTWSNAVDTASVPYAFFEGGAVTIGTDIYLFGGSNYTNNYKYNTLTNTYTKLSDIPYNFRNGSVVAVNTNIYILGGDLGSRKECYKYDTLTDTYTKQADIPYTFGSGSAVAVDNDIYLFGGATSNAYKYNTVTDTYINLTNVPYTFNSGSSVVIGNNIFLLGYATGGVTYNYRYNILTDTYTKLANIPYIYQTSSNTAVAVGADIYILGSNYSGYANNNYKYDTLTDTYTKLTDVPYKFTQGSVTSIGTDIYIFGSGESSYYKASRIYHIENKSYVTDNTVVIAQGKTYNIGYNIKLFNTNFEEDFQPLYGFADVYFYTTQNGLITDIPTYYGDGTQWVNFKNPSSNN